MKNGLLTLINSEDKKNPFTDKELSEQLNIRRDAVTTLRGELGISDSRERRKPYLSKALTEILAKNPKASDRELTRQVKEQGFNVSRFLISQLRVESGVNSMLPSKKPHGSGSKGYGKSNDAAEVTAFDSIVGYDGSLKPQIEQAKAAVLYPPHGLHTLILGPTGSGKSNLAEAMYNFAVQIGKLPSGAPFVVFNCADYAETPQLLLSQLFGHSKGAYTGAEVAKEGLIEKADGGILFLDEIHRLPPEGQEILYFIMDKGKFRRLGETENLRTVNIMIIAATSEDITSSLLLTFRRRIPMNIELSPITERPLSERYQIIREFFCKEADRTEAWIKVSQVALRALLLYDCPGNIGQLRSDIQVACARGFLTYVGSKKDAMEIDLSDLPTHVRRGLLGDESRQPEVESILQGDFSTKPGEIENKTVLKEDLYTLPGEIYQYIEDKYLKLQQKGLRQEEINRTIGAELEIKFQRLIKQVETSQKIVTKPELAEIVGKKVVAMAEKVTEIAEQKLGKVDDHLFYCIAVHLSATLDRIQQGKVIINPHLKNVMKDYKKEYEVAEEIADYIEEVLGYKFPQDEVGFIAMYLRAVSHPGNTKKGRVGVVVLTHGQVAQGMADVVNRLLGVNHAVGIEMSLDEKPEFALQRTIEVVKKVEEGKGVLILADMGSLLAFGETVTQRTGIPTKTVGRVNTIMVLEAVRRALLVDTNLEEIASIIDVDKKTPTNFTPDIVPKENTILTICITGEGTAIRLKGLIEKMMPEIHQKAEIIPLGIIGNEDVSTAINRIKATRNVVAIVGTIDPGDDKIPFISVEDIVKGTATDSIRKILELGEPSQVSIEHIETDFPLAGMVFDDLILPQADYTTKNEALDGLANLLIGGGFTREYFLLDVYRRETMGPTIIADNIAIPHGNPGNVVKPAIAVAVLREPIEWWGEKKVEIVFMLALKEDSREAFRKFHKLIKDKDFISKMKATPVSADIKRCLLEKAITCN